MTIQRICKCGEIDLAKMVKRTDENGIEIYRNLCRKCNNKGQRARAAKRKESAKVGDMTFVRDYKSMHHDCLTPLHLKMQSMKWVQI